VWGKECGVGWREMREGWLGDGVGGEWGVGGGVWSGLGI